ncbi:MAG TPA: YdcH family protein [Wenzhouxiangella sp.]|nr:YdcH family protein [Wenzhouxiangella sp.]
MNRRLQELRQEHRDLDQAIERLADNPAMDQLQLRRMKKRKLRLRDQIAWYESCLIPDLDA